MDKEAIRRQLRSFPVDGYRLNDKQWAIIHRGPPVYETELKPEDHEPGVWNAVLLDLERWPDAK